MASDGVSKTGSLRQGVRRFSLLLSDHVHPREDSLTRQPNSSFVSTLHHGAGVPLSAPTEMTYSAPSGVNPPVPLSKTSSGRATTREPRSGVRVASNRGK